MISTRQYGPLTKSIDVDEALMLIGLTREFDSVAAWQEECLYRLPQASRQRRQEIVRAVRRKFLQTESDRFLTTPLVTLLVAPTLDARLKRDLLFAQYLRATPLVWEAIQQVVLPRAESGTQPLAKAEDNEISLEDWEAFLEARLNTSPFISVIVISVLLKVALIWAIPRATLRRTRRLPDRFATTIPLPQFLYALLPGNRLPRSLPGPGVRPRSLAPYRKVNTVTNASITLDVLQPGDIRLDHPAKLSLYLVVPVDHATDPSNLLFRQVLPLAAGLDLRLLEHVHRELGSDSIYIAQRELDTLVSRNIHSCNTWHLNSP